MLHLHHNNMIEQRSTSNKIIILQLSSAKVKISIVHMQAWLKLYILYILYTVLHKYDSYAFSVLEIEVWIICCDGVYHFSKYVTVIVGSWYKKSGWVNFMFVLCSCCCKHSKNRCIEFHPLLRLLYV